MIYFEDKEIRSISTPEFSWRLDKNKKMTISWGSTFEDDPQFDPISPETIEVVFGKDYQCDIDLWNRLLNIKHDLDVDEKFSGGFISTVAFLEVSTPEGITNEISNTLKWLKTRSIVVMNKMNQSDIDFKNIMILSNNKIDFVLLKATDMHTLKNSIDQILMNNILVKLQINADEFKVEDIEEFLKISPKSIGIDIISENENTIETLMKCADENGLFDVKFYSSKIKNENVFKMNSLLFSCIYDFIKNEIYFNNNRRLKFKMSDVKSITDYWNDSKTEAARNKILKK